MCPLQSLGSLAPTAVAAAGIEMHSSTDPKRRLRHKQVTEEYKELLQKPGRDAVVTKLCLPSSHYRNVSYQEIYSALTVISTLSTINKIY